MFRLFLIFTMLFIYTGKSIACETADLLMRLSGSSGGPPVILSRPANQHSWDVPGGVFKIHYDTEGPYTVYNVGEDIDPPDGIPDYVNRIGDYLSIAHEAFINDFGFDTPPSDGSEGGDQLYDIYITNVPALTTPEYLSFQYPGREAYTSYIQLGFDMRTPRYPDDPLPFLKVSAAHEYFHAVQFAYRVYSSDVTPWWFESSAGWAEEAVFDSINDVYFKLHYYLPDLHKSLYQSQGFFTYGSWLFSEFLAERHGNSVIRKCWEKYASFDLAVDAIDLTLDEMDIEFNDEYTSHILWNYFTGGNFAPGFYEEGEDFQESVYEAAVHWSFPVDWVSNPVPQENLSGAYIVFQNTTLGNGSLIIEYLNPTPDKHSVVIASVRPDLGMQFNIYLIQNYIINTFVVEDFKGCEKVIMMPVWLYEGAPNSGVTSYSYSAHIDSAAVGIANSGAINPSRFELISAFPNPFNGAVQISFSSPIDTDYKAAIYNISGSKVYEAKIQASAGLNNFTWTPSKDVASGIHFFEISKSDNSINGKFIYLK